MPQRWTSLSLLLAALLVATPPAHAVTGGLTPLPPVATDGKVYAAGFAIGLSVDGGKTWQDSATLDQQVLLKGSLDPDPAHVGQRGDVFVVELYNGKYTMLTAGGTWLPWSGKVAELQPAQDDITLAATQEVTIHSGSIMAAGQHRLFIGYLAASATTLIYSKSPATLEFKPAVVTPLSYFGQNIFDDIVMTKCTLCHVDGGVANGSGLHFVKNAGLVQQNYDAFTRFYAQLVYGKSYVLGKVSGGNGHAGGVQLPAGSADYQKFAAFLDLLDGTGIAVTPDAQALFDGVALQSPADTLRDAALLLAGRLPTAGEIAAVTAGGEAGLKSAVITMMQGAHFHKFLKDGADDRLLLRGNEDFNLMDDCFSCFPPLNAQYWALKDKADQGGSVLDRGALNLFMTQLQFGAIEAPLELIAWVVENDRPYSEILTADYDMLTPLLNSIVGGTASFPAGSGNSDFRPGRITGYYLRDAGTQLQPVAGAAIPRMLTPPKLAITYPHAGILSSKAFLSRYPTTATNRNRARARWAWYHFLGVDVEALAKRTTDPVALADTNNPTMNNPACTVCHTVLDPVAGTFQDYADNGTYRSSLNGIDSLDRFYKSPLTGPGLYKAGDLWYRDMRDPGFEGSKPGSGNALQWLAQQIVKDPRFATATVRFWWPAVMGAELLHAPEAAEDTNYTAKLAAYSAQQAEIAALADGFVKAGLSLKSLLADMVLSPWYRAERISGTPTAVQVSARALAPVSGEKLLTPEQLARKTNTLTGFNWNAQIVPASGAEVSGLENDYNTFYGGIDGFALKVRARTLTPMMSNVAAAHALEASCPIVLGDFIRPHGQRLLFDGFSPLVTPLTEQATMQTLTSTSETDFNTVTLTADLPAGTHQIVVSLQNDACDYAANAAGCRNDKNLVVNTLTLRKPDGSSLVLSGSSGTAAACAAVTGNNRMTLYASCTATYDFVAEQKGSYVLSASLAAKQQPNDPVVAGVNIEAASAATTTDTPGAALIKQRLVELHGKLLGQTVTTTSPEVLASYDLLLQTWLGRKAAGSTPSLLQSKALACEWSNDIGFIGSLGYPGNPLLNGRYNMPAINSWLLPRAQDALLTKQSWVVVMTYLLSHYDYLHE